MSPIGGVLVIPSDEESHDPCTCVIPSLAATRLTAVRCRCPDQQLDVAAVFCIDYRLAPGAVLTLHQVPGAFEIPIVVREVALQKKADAIIAIGVILKGHTTHAEHLSHSVTNALQQIALEFGVPVINAVLGMENEEQARERCLEDRINRGTEAARAAVEISSVLADLRPR